MGPAEQDVLELEYNEVRITSEEGQPDSVKKGDFSYYPNTKLDPSSESYPQDKEAFATALADHILAMPVWAREVWVRAVDIVNGEA